MVEPFANSGDPDQTPHSVASDLGQDCLPITLLGVSRLQWVYLLRYTYHTGKQNGAKKSLLKFYKSTEIIIHCILSS